MNDTITNRIRRIERHALELTAFRNTDSPPAYDIRDSLLRELHRE
jgi:hypothetical protein